MRRRTVVTCRRRRPAIRAGAAGAPFVVGVVLIAIMVAGISATGTLLPPVAAPAAPASRVRAGQGLRLGRPFRRIAGLPALAAVVYGAWQIRTGRQDKRVIAAATASLAVPLAGVAML